MNFEVDSAVNPDERMLITISFIDHLPDKDFSRGISLNEEGSFLIVNYIDGKISEFEMFPLSNVKSIKVFFYDEGKVKK